MFYLRPPQDRFEEIKAEFRAFASKLNITDLSFVPVSALHGDNVVTRSLNSPWYEGSSLLHHLEEVHIASDRNLIDVRFPVQYVIRPHSDQWHDYRGYAGTVASGVLKPGDEVTTISFHLAPFVSPTRLSGDNTSPANFAASSRIASTTSGEASSQPGKATT